MNTSPSSGPEETILHAFIVLFFSQIGGQNWKHDVSIQLQFQSLQWANFQFWRSNR